MNIPPISLKNITAEIKQRLNKMLFRYIMFIIKGMIKFWREL